jgi:hypothetical protein
MHVSSLVSSPIATERLPSSSKVALTTRKPASPSIEKRKKPTSRGLKT